MDDIKLIAELNIEPANQVDQDIAVEKLFDGPFRTLVAIRLRNSSVLKRHSADVPITVQCISGQGTFCAGVDLKESIKMRSGTLITLDAAIEHELTADPAIHILVTKFRAA